MGWLAEARALPSDERKIVLAAAGMLVVARVGLALMPLPSLRGLLERMACVLDRSSHGVPAGRVGRLVAGLGRRLPVPTTCLSQAVVCEALLARAGRHAVLKIGVMREPRGGIASHAWVECGRVVVIGNRHDLGRYARLRS